MEKTEVELRPNTEVWLSVDDAAERLGLKRRRMLDYADKIKCRKVPNPKSGKSALMFQEADVERARRARETAAAESVGVMRNAAAPGLQHRPIFLDLDQAADYSGLSQRLLRSMIRCGELRARRDGRVWKIRRSALKAIEDQAFGEPPLFRAIEGGV